MLHKNFNFSKSILLGLALIVGLGLSGCSEEESELDKAAKVAVKSQEAIFKGDVKTFINLMYIPQDLPASEKNDLIKG